MASEELTPEQLSALLSGSLPEIKGYRVLRRIGRGGMSYVYLCVQESLDRLVAIKIISPDALVDEVSKQRFETEARTIAKLEHPGIVSIHEVGRTPQGLLYYVMPYLPKGHLGQTDFTKDEAKVAEILRSLLSALGYLHERGIVHRDVKADNVLFDSADRPLLTDFGIALSRADTARITTAGLALGSGGYMAPEQARGEAVDGRADLYSVGVLAFELLTGRLPFLGNDALSQALMHASDPIPRLPTELKHWQAFIDKAMAKNAAKRYQNTGEMLRALDRACGHDQFTSRQTQAITAMDFRGHGSGKRNALIAVAVLAVAGLGYAGWKYTSGSPAAPAPTKPAVAKVPAIMPSSPSATPADPAASDPVATGPAAADPAATAAPGTETGDPAAAPADAAAPDAPLASAKGDFSRVKGELLLGTLSYDPAIPGARQITAAKRQLGQKRLTSPAGDNAIESLTVLHQLAPKDPALVPLADEAIAAVGKSLVEAVEARRDNVARSSYQMTEKFVRQAARGDSEPWKALQASLPPLLLKRLEADARSGDPAGGSATKALAGVFKVPQSQLEPAWSQASVQPRAVAAPSASAGPYVTVSGVGGERISVMREEVTRGEYGQFVADTQRPDTTCRNRNLPFALRKKHWNEPGFPQDNSHPVVCVSHADALAYAQWLGQRTGNSYRLPRRAEWQIIADYAGSDDACSNGHIGCGNRGTAPARRGPASPAGMNGLQGNVREWLNDCDGGCKRRLAAGLGWRDGPKNADPGRSAGLDSESGYDDIGFRLIRE